MKNNYLILSIFVSACLHAGIFVYAGKRIVFDNISFASNKKTSLKVNLNLNNSSALHKNEQKIPILNDDKVESNTSENDNKIIIDKINWNDFVESKYLDVHPTAIDPIIVETPSNSMGKVAGRVVIAVYIDKYGTVKKVEIIKSDVPIEYNILASQAFERAQFYPGILDSSVVSSKMTIEIGFFEELN